MIFKIYTLFPDFFVSPLKSGLLGKAVESGIIRIEVIDIREYSDDSFKRCDDYPYGGGSGMVIMPEPVFRALEANEKEEASVLYTTPSGKPLTQEFVKTLSREEAVSIICGHYEGIDQRIIDTFVDLEISTGDYVLSGGNSRLL